MINQQHFSSGKGDETKALFLDDTGMHESRPHPKDRRFEGLPRFFLGDRQRRVLPAEELCIIISSPHACNVKRKPRNVYSKTCDPFDPSLVSSLHIKSSSQFAHLPLHCVRITTPLASTSPSLKFNPPIQPPTQPTPPSPPSSPPPSHLLPPLPPTPQKQPEHKPASACKQAAWHLPSYVSNRQRTSRHRLASRLPFLVFPPGGTKWGLMGLLGRRRMRMPGTNKSR